MEQGLHWKATLAAMGRGENALFVRHAIGQKVEGQSLNEHTPLVFLLAEEVEIERSEWFLIHDSNLAQRNIDTGNAAFPFDRDPAPDHVFSVLRTSRSRQPLLGRHVEKEDVTLCVSCTPGTG